MPGDYKPPPTGDRGAKAKRVMARVYEECRSKNPDYPKSKCAKISWGAVHRATGEKSMGKAEDVKPEPHVKPEEIDTTSTDPYHGREMDVEASFREALEAMFDEDLDYDGQAGAESPAAPEKESQEAITERIRREKAGLSVEKHAAGGVSLEKADRTRWFEGWGSVQVQDKQNDVIAIKEFVPIIPLIEKRYNRIFDSHTDLMVGELTKIEVRDKEVESKGADGVMRKEKVPGLWFRGFIYDDYALQDAYWDRMKSGEFKGFSLRGGANDMKLACSDSTCSSMHRIPQKMEITAFSIVHTPANQEATLDRMNMMAKSFHEPALPEIAKEIRAAAEGCGCLGKQDDPQVSGGDIKLPGEDEDPGKDASGVAGVAMQILPALLALGKTFDRVIKDDPDILEGEPPKPKPGMGEDARYAIEENIAQAQRARRHEERMAGAGAPKPSEEEMAGYKKSIASLEGHGYPTPHTQTEEGEAEISGTVGDFLSRFVGEIRDNLPPGYRMSDAAEPATGAASEETLSNVG